MGWLNVFRFTLPFNNSQGFEPQAGHISNMTSLFFILKKNNKDFISFGIATLPCKCKIENNFEDLFEKNKYKYYKGHIIEFNKFFGKKISK